MAQALPPLLGLLGTVFGMIQMFLKILTTGVGDVNQALATYYADSIETTAAATGTDEAVLEGHRRDQLAVDAQAEIDAVADRGRRLAAAGAPQAAR